MYNVPSSPLRCVQVKCAISLPHMARAHGVARSRQQTVPVHTWWRDAVRRELERQGIDQAQLADRLGVDAPAVSRCISLQVPSLRLVVEISRLLVIPCPVLFPESEVLAAHLAQQHRLVRDDLQLRDMLGELVDGAAQRGARGRRNPGPDDELAARRGKRGKRARPPRV